MRSYEENLYSNPENMGYEIVEVMELDEPCYSFDLLVVWRDPEGELKWATDSGCSCPVPFEFTGPEDLYDFDYAAIEAEARGGYGYERMKMHIEDKLANLRKL